MSALVAIYVVGLLAGMYWAERQSREQGAPDHVALVFLWPIVAAFLLFYLFVDYCIPGGWHNDPENTGPE